MDGRELFGDDATAALHNLPAEIIDQIQVFDRLSDQTALTGFDDGNTQKGINTLYTSIMQKGFETFCIRKKCFKSLLRMVSLGGRRYFGQYFIHSLFYRFVWRITLRQQIKF